MGLRIIFKSMWGRKERILIVFVALSLAGVVLSLILHFSSAAEKSFRVIFQSYGANMIILPESLDFFLGGERIEIARVEEERWLKEEVIESLEGEIPHLHISPLLYSIGKINKKSVVFVGVDFKRFKKVAPLWTMQGKIPSRENEALLGVGIYKKMGAEIGEKFKLEVFPYKYNFKIAGYFNTGGAEDYQIFVPLKSAQRITRKEHLINFALVRLDLPPGEIEEISKRLEREAEGIDVKLLQGIIQGEERGFKKIIHTLLWVAGIVLTAVGLCVMTALADIVLERKREIALFKSLGANNHQLVRIILGESLFLAFLSGLVGYFLGLGLAEIISQRTLGQGVRFNTLIFTVSLAGTFGIAFVSTIFPLRKTIRIEPAKILRGE